MIYFRADDATVVEAYFIECKLLKAKVWIAAIFAGIKTMKSTSNYLL